MYICFKLFCEKTSERGDLEIGQMLRTRFFENRGNDMWLGINLSWSISHPHFRWNNPRFFCISCKIRLDSCVWEVMAYLIERIVGASPFRSKYTRQ